MAKTMDSETVIEAISTLDPERCSFYDIVTAVRNLRRSSTNSFKKVGRSLLQLLYDRQITVSVVYGRFMYKIVEAAGMEDTRFSGQYPFDLSVAFPAYLKGVVKPSKLRWIIANSPVVSVQNLFRASGIPISTIARACIELAGVGALKIKVAKLPGQYLMVFVNENYTFDELFDLGILKIRSLADRILAWCTLYKDNADIVSSYDIGYFLNIGNWDTIRSRCSELVRTGVFILRNEGNRTYSLSPSYWLELQHNGKREELRDELTKRIEVLKRSSAADNSPRMEPEIFLY